MDATTELLRELRKVSENNIRLLDLIERKTVPRTLKTTAPTDEDAEIAAKAVQEEQARAAQRHKAVAQHIKITMHEIRCIINKQEQAIAAMNDRAFVTKYEKIMAWVAITLGYDVNDMAHALHITGKHMKKNIMPNEQTRTYLDTLGWLGRCPNPDCGIILKDAVEALLAGKQSLDDDAQYHTLPDNVEPEPLIPTGYQASYLKALKK